MLVGVAGGAGVAGVIAVALVTHEAARASAVLNAAAVTAAVVLGLSAYRTSSAQLRAARLATYLAHRPVLVPVHDPAGMSIDQADAVGLDGRVEPTFPSITRFKVLDSEPSERVFRVNARRGRPDAPSATVCLRNVGDGPAIVQELTVRNLAGVGGALTGSAAIGARGDEIFVIQLAGGGEDIDDARAPEELEQLAESDRVFVLDIVYEDVFTEPRRYALRAWFDPRDRGGWRFVELSDD